MRPTTLLSLCACAVLALLATQPQPARAAIILPLIIYKKLPKHDPHQLLKKLLQFINVDVITGLVGQLINFEAILRHFSPPSAKKTTTTAASQPTVMMMSDQPPVPSPAPTAFPTLPPIPVTPEMEAGPVSDCLCANAAPSERRSRWEAADAKRSA